MLKYIRCIVISPWLRISSIYCHYLQRYLTIVARYRTEIIITWRISRWLQLQNFRLVYLIRLCRSSLTAISISYTYSIITRLCKYKRCIRCSSVKRYSGNRYVTFIDSKGIRFCTPCRRKQLRCRNLRRTTQSNITLSICCRYLQLCWLGNSKGTHYLTIRIVLLST